MKILVLAWEFPPRIVGGIARHVAELYPELVRLGHTIHLITVEFGQAPLYELVEGIHVHRVPVGHSHHFFQWVAQMNDSMGFYGGKILLKEGPFDMIHAHDWLVGDAAIALKYHFKVPLVATIHATEYGRFNGLFNQDHHYVNRKENELVDQAWRVIVCTDYMRQEVERVWSTPWHKIEVIYNGIRPEKKSPLPQLEALEFRRRYANDDEKIVYFVGRITYEKGISVLLNASPKVFQEMGGKVRFFIIGSGNLEGLKQQALDLGMGEYCHFTGFMDEQNLDKFQTVADCAVFPSLYEPFGIVALESFAARVPVVVSNTGGLPEVVQHSKTGIVTITNDPNSLAWGILEVLKNPEHAQQLVTNAYDDLERRFTWDKLARQTEWVYQRVLEERSQQFREN